MHGFGVPSAFHQPIKIWGPITLEDTLFVFAAVVFAMIFRPCFSNDTTVLPQIGFDLSIFALTGYSMLSPRTNPGKRNIDLLFLSFRHTNRFFQSISISQSVRMSSLYSFGVKGPHRLHVSRADLRGNE